MSKSERVQALSKRKHGVDDDLTFLCVSSLPGVESRLCSPQSFVPGALFSPRQIVHLREEASEADKTARQMQLPLDASNHRR